MPNQEGRDASRELLAPEHSAGSDGNIKWPGVRIPTGKTL